MAHVDGEAYSMTKFSKLIVFVWLALRAYRKACKSGNPQYVALAKHGIQEMAMYVAVGREAWRISEIAVREFEPMRIIE